MDAKGQPNQLESAVGKFSEVIWNLPEDLFLTRIDEWTPRDVTAHLVWWNRNMLAACKRLQAGKAPEYYADASNDYRNINARAITEFPSNDRRALLEQMNATLQEFKSYLLALEPKEWDAERGVTHYRGGVATIHRVVESLTGDYINHIQQIERWNSQPHIR